MIVWVIGATGYIGNAVARAFVAAGHHVHALHRKEADAKSLAALEIQPHCIKAEEVDTWVKAMLETDVQVIVDCSMPETTPEGKAKHVSGILNGVEAIAAKSGRKPLFIYTSGLWHYPHLPNRPLLETTPPPDQTSCPPAFAWRLPYEARVLNAIRYDSAVIRPPSVHGLSSRGGPARMFQEAAEGKLVVFGDPKITTTPFVHVDDIAEAYALIAAKWEKDSKATEYTQLPGAEERCYHIVASKPVLLDDLAKKMVQAANKVVHKKDEALSDAEVSSRYKWQMPDPNDWFQVGISNVHNVNAQKAEERLGWKPKRPHLDTNVELYMASWQAHLD